MNLGLLDPKVIVLAAVLIVVVLCWFGCTYENAGVPLQACAKSSGPSMTALC